MRPRILSKQINVATHTKHEIRYGDLGENEYNEPQNRHGTHESHFDQQYGRQLLGWGPKHS